jgi:uncharacterized protein (TIGR04255 family)
LTIPGLFYEQIKQDFPLKEQQNLVGIEFQIEKGGIGSSRPAPTIPKMVFRTPDKSGLLQVSPDTFAVNKLPPYGGWVVFREVIVKNFQEYQRIAVGRKLSAVTLHYINRVKVEQKAFSLEQYFNVLPQIPTDAGGPIITFMMSTRLTSDSPKGILTITSAAENPDDGSSFIFDFQFTSRGADCPSADQLVSWLDLAHNKISVAFDGSLTEKAHKELFKEKSL